MCLLKKGTFLLLCVSVLPSFGYEYPEYRYRDYPERKGFLDRIKEKFGRSHYADYVSSRDGTPTYSSYSPPSYSYSYGESH